MKKLHLTRYAAMASIALMGTSAAWGQNFGTGWETAAGNTELQLSSSLAEELVSISNSEISDYMGGVKTITVWRVDPAAEFSTLMLPASVDVADAYKYSTENGKVEDAYLPTEYNSVTQTMDFESQETIEANKPYLVRVSGSPTVFAFKNTSGYSVVATSAAELSVTLEKSCWEFTGSYAKKTWETAPSNVYGYAAASGDGYCAGQFVKVGKNVTLPPLRAYLTCTRRGLSKSSTDDVSNLPDVINVRLLGKSGETLSIGTMNTRTGEIQMQDRYYDLKGRKLNGKPQNKIMYVNKKVIKH